MIQAERPPSSKTPAMPPVAKTGSFVGWKSRASDVAAVDLGGQFVDERAQALDVRVQRERLAVSLEGARLVAGRHVDVAEAGPGAEMARLADENLAEIGHGAG